MEPIRRAFLIGYAYAMGVRYGLGLRLALDGEFRETDHPRNKDGKFTSGGSGSKSATGKAFPNTGKNLLDRKQGKTPGQYLREAKGNVRRAIVDYYDNELRGGYVDTRLEMRGKMVPVRVEFDAKGREEFRKFAGESDLILDAVAAAPEVLASGEYAGRHIEKKHFPQVAFHTKFKKVMTRAGMKWVAVDIGESKKGDLHAYSVNTEGISTFERKPRHLKEASEKRKSGQDTVIQNSVQKDSALLPSSKDSAIFYAPGRQPPDHFMKKMITRNSDSVKCRVVGIRILD